MTDDTLPEGSRIGRVALRVADLDRLVAFYRDVVGLTVRSRDDGTATLGTADAPLLELSADPEAPERPEDAAGLFHTAFRVPSRAALADALARVREQWRLTGASDHHVSDALYLRDPEGNGVEVYADRPRSEWRSTDDGRVHIGTDPLDLDALAAEAARPGDRAGDGATTVPAGTDVGHVHLEVTSLAAAREHYVDRLGLGVRHEVRGALFLAAGDYHHHVGCNVWNGRSAPASGRGLAWFEVVVPDAESLAAVRQRCERAGLAVPDREDPVGHASQDGAFAVTDGDGVEVRVRADPSA